MIGVATALVIAAWKFGDAGTRGVVDVGAGDGKPAKKHPATPRKHQPPSTATGVRLVVRATKGDSWLEVHHGSPAGKIEYQGTLERGHTQVFTTRHLWLRIDYPRNVVVKLNGMQDAAARLGAARADADQPGPEAVT